jgi:hypothetical protein
MSASTRAARAYARNAPDGWLACRGRHRHNLAAPTELGTSDKVELKYDRAEHVYQMIYYCLDCGGKGVQEIDSRSGVLASRIRFTPPPGYKFTGGEGFPMDQAGIGQVRLEQIRRGLERQEEARQRAAKRPATSASGRSRGRGTSPQAGVRLVPFSGEGQA